MNRKTKRMHSTTSTSTTKEKLREKLSQLRHMRMSRHTAVNRLKKQTKQNGEEDMEKKDEMNKMLEMYDSFTKQRGMAVLHPNEALGDVDKYRPIVEQLTKTFAPNHPLTAYYRMILSLLTSLPTSTVEES